MKRKRLPKSDSASTLISEICHSKENFDKVEVNEIFEKLDESSKDMIL